MNFFEVTVNGSKISDGDNFEIDLPEGKAKFLKEKGYEGKKVTMGIRPEDVSISELTALAYPNTQIEAEIVVSELLGAETMLYAKVGQTELVSRVGAKDIHQPGEHLTMTINLNKAHFFDIDTDIRIVE
jgi:multiple sugar transport system ATP-binding protein